MRITTMASREHVEMRTIPSDIHIDHFPVFIRELSHYTRSPRQHKFRIADVSPAASRVGQTPTLQVRDSSKRLIP